MFSGVEIVDVLGKLEVTHVVWVPDSALGPWEDALDASDIALVRVCREGEAWPLAAGLHLGGKSPVVVMQATGVFESGDALRNVLFDLKLPIYAIVGARSWLVPDTRDSAKRFTEPVLRAWELDYILIASDDAKPRLSQHYLQCRASHHAGIALIAEGRM